MPTAIDAYLERFDGPTLSHLAALRDLIRSLVPDEATETISYGIPTVDLAGKHLVHFAGYAQHVGFYPTPIGIEAFREELADYPHSKGAVRFAVDRPLPVDLIRRMVDFRVTEVMLIKP